MWHSSFKAYCCTAFSGLYFELHFCWESFAINSVKQSGVICVYYRKCVTCLASARTCTVFSRNVFVIDNRAIRLKEETLCIQLSCTYTSIYNILIFLSIFIWSYEFTIQVMQWLCNGLKTGIYVHLYNEDDIKNIPQGRSTDQLSL